MSSFVNLHTHSHFSLLDGLGKPEEYINRATELSQPAVALTDHGSLSGLYSLWKNSQGTGVKPIAGCEFYVAPKSRQHKEPVYFGTPDQRKSDVSRSGSYCHITVLARNSDGLRNLFRLQAEAYRTGFYSKPRIDLELLNTYRDGLVCLSGCPGGMLCTYVRLGQHDKAREHAADLKDTFGDDFYVELMSHGIDFEPEMNSELLRIAHELKLPVVATADAHYCHLDDSTVHSALLCLQTGSKLANPKFTFAGSGYHLASHDEMQRSFAEASLPYAAIEATAVIAQQVESYDSVFGHQLRMPKSTYGEAAGTALATLSIDGLGKRIPNYDSEYATRLEYEINTLCGLGFADYLLVVADIVNAAKEKGIPVGPGRGSSGGSLVAYALGINDLNPIPSKLLFERFVNPERVGLPDIDIDVAEDRREEFIDIAREKYGEGCVASLGTFGTVGAKAALKDSARVLGHSYKTGEERTLQLPPARFGKSPTLKEYKGERDEIFDLAVGLEGTVRNESVHSAAVVISPEPLERYLPLRRPGGKGGDVVAFDMHEVEAMGFVKTDFLGLTTLKVIHDCLQMLSSQDGTSGAPDVSLRHVHPLPTEPERCTDPATYDLLSSGNTPGVFQLDGGGMRRLLRDVHPTSFADIGAVLALYRPGPMGADAHNAYARRKRNQERVSYIHPELAPALEPILEETYGLVVYQEQVLEILAAVGDYTYASAELIFNAMRKKQLEKMQQAKPDFIQRMTDGGYSQGAIDALWDTLVPFADYSFNKSHSYGYALFSYWCAYLKSNYPREFMSSLLSNEQDNAKRAEYLNNCTEMGIDLLPPDVNTSDASFTPTPEGIRYGLEKVKGAGEAAVAALISKRPYKNLNDFYRRAPAVVLNSGVLGALVRAGALDSLTGREGHVDTYEALAEKARSERQARKQGQRGLVAVRYRSPGKPVNMKQRRKWERETLGIELSTTPVVLVPHEPLTAPAMEWLRATLMKYPGRQDVMLALGGRQPYNTGVRVDVERAQRALVALGVSIIELDGSGS